MTTKKITLQPDDFAVILSTYNLKNFLQAQPFEHGSVQTNVRVDSTQGSFVLRYYENRSVEWVTYETSLIRFLVEKGFPTPAVIGDKQGRSFSLYRGKPYVLFQFVEGEHPSDLNVDLNSGQAACVARTIARMHVLTHKMVLPFEKVREGRDVSTCYRVASDGAALMADRAVAGERLAWLKEALALVDLPSGLPWGVCHGDCNRRNFIFDKGALVGVLDFDMATHSVLVTDLASLIYWWAWPPGEDLKLDVAREMMRAYSEVREVSRVEQLHLLSALKLVVLFSLAWFIADDAEFEQVKAALAKLEAFDTERFAALMFG